MLVFTYVWMPADSLDNILVEMAGVSKKTWDVVGVFESGEGLECELGELRQIPLALGIFDLDVLVLNPSMVLTGRSMGYMLLENDHI